jgi:hypothetical protein
VVEEENEDLRANEKMVPADCAPKRMAGKQRKNWKRLYSPRAKSVPPYQKPRAMHRKVNDCEAAYNVDDLMTDRKLFFACTARASW